MLEILADIITIHPLVTIGFGLLVLAMVVSILSGLLDILMYLLAIFGMLLLLFGGVVVLSETLSIILFCRTIG